MTKPETAAALLAATLIAFATSYATSQARAATAPASSVANADFAARESRLLRLIQVGRAEGWLDRTEARAAYRTLRQLRTREAELAASPGGLSARGRDELQRGFDDLAQDLRWTRMRNSQGRYRPH